MVPVGQTVCLAELQSPLSITDRQAVASFSVLSRLCSLSSCPVEDLNKMCSMLGIFFECSCVKTWVMGCFNVGFLNYTHILGSKGTWGDTQIILFNCMTKHQVAPVTFNPFCDLHTDQRVYDISCTAHNRIIGLDKRHSINADIRCFSESN